MGCSIPQYGDIPLHNAATKGSLEIASMLLAKGSHINVKNKVSLHNSFCHSDSVPCKKNHKTLVILRHTMYCRNAGW